MSVDVEEYFQVQALSGHIGRQDWDRRDSRVELSTNRVLDLFEAHGAKGHILHLWAGSRSATRH